jgi:hypothetical protein
VITRQNSLQRWFETRDGGDVQRADDVLELHLGMHNASVSIRKLRPATRFVRVPLASRMEDPRVSVEPRRDDLAEADTQVSGGCMRG